MRLTAAYIGWVGVVMTIARTRGAAAGDEHDDDDPSPSPGYRPLPLTPAVEEPLQPLFHGAASYQQPGPPRRRRPSRPQGYAMSGSAVRLVSEVPGSSLTRLQIDHQDVYDSNGG